MEIWILRHAEAEERSETGRDADRRLTESGRNRMKAVARAIAGLEPGFDVILTSPYARARQTAEPVAVELGMKKGLVDTDSLVPEADPALVLEELERRKARAALLVGHSPHLGFLLGRLVTGEDEFEMPLKKAALARVTCRESPLKGRGTVRFLLPPGVLERLGSI